MYCYFKSAQIIPSPMRLYQRNGWYHVEFKRGKSLSLKTKDEESAIKLFKKLEEKSLESRLQLLDETDRITISKFKKRYVESRFHLSSSTTRADELALRLLADVVGHDKPMKLINQRSIDEFISVCHARGVVNDSINTYLRHLRAAFNTANRYGYIKSVPSFRPLPKKKKLHRVLSSDEINTLLKHTKSVDVDMWRIILFGLWTGCRRKEILEALWQDVVSNHKGDPFVRIVGKGDNERRVPLLPGALEALGEKKDIGPIFRQFNKDTVSHRFQNYCGDVGIQGAKFHSLRHTAATFMVSKGIKLELIQKVLGHSDIRTTQIYAEIYDEVVLKEMGKLNFD